MHVQPGGSLSWSVRYGASAKHSFTLRYQGATRGRLTLTDESGIVAADLPLIFAGGETGAWQEVTVETAPLINAGTYGLKLTADGALGVDVLKMR